MFQRCLIPLLLLGLIVWPAAAQERPAGQSVAELVAPLVSDDLVAVARLRTRQIDLPSTINWAVEAMDLPAEEVKLIRRDVAVPESILKAFHAAGGQEIVWLVFPSTVHSPGQPIEIAGVAVASEGKAEQLSEFLSDLVDQFKLQVKQDGNRVFFGPPHRLEGFKAQAKPDSNLAKAIASTGDATLQVAILLPDDYRRVFSETLPSLPEQFGGANGKDLAEWFRWGSIGVTLLPSPQLTIIVQTPNDKAALSLAQATSRWYEAVAPIEELRASVPSFDNLKPLITPKATQDQVVVRIRGQEDVRRALSALAVPLKAARSTALRAEQMHRMKQIGLAMHMYHDKHGRLPLAATRSKEGKTLLSWRVHLLPFLGQEALYKEFRLDEPWDSEHNKRLLARMPQVYASERVPIGKEGYTALVVPVADSTIFGDPEGMRIQKITDGTSNTVLVIETDAKHAVPWTKPEDLQVRSENPSAGLFVDSGNQIMLLIADGSVRSISAAETKEKLSALFTANGGEVIP